ncbi:MAG: APC family permease [Deltaproteobacteria bacterium]|nr:APC family permease [Deltaproteobacteria bacterium]
MTQPTRRLGLTVTAAIVIANMIGTGVFTSAGFQAAALHDPMTILACWVVGGVLALCGAAAYAELGSMMPHAGGEYVYLREAYHPVVGFMSGWVSLTAGFSAPIATASILFSIYLATLIPALQTAEPWVSGVVTVGPQQVISLALIGLITLLHTFDTKVGSSVQAVFTAAKVLLIVLLILGGLFLGDGNWSNLASQSGGLANIGTTAFATSLMYVSFAYSGWNAAAYIANEVERPERNLPRALLLGTGTVMVLYVLLNLVFLYAVPSSVLAGEGGGGPVIEVGDVAAKALFGSSAGKLVSSVIAIALVSSVSAMIMAGPRVYAAMAKDRALPQLLAQHNDRGVPVFAVIAQGVIASIFVLVGDLGSLIRFVGFTLAIFAALTVSAVFVLRARGHRAAYRTFGYPLTPVAFIALSAWIAYSQIRTQPKESLVVACVLAVGAALYTFVAHGKPPHGDQSLPPTARVVDDGDRS